MAKALGQSLGRRTIILILLLLLLTFLLPLLAPIPLLLIWFKTKWKKSVKIIFTVITLVLVALNLSIVYLFPFYFNDQKYSPTEVVTNYGQLEYITPEEKNKILNEIESAKTIPDLDFKLFNVIADTFRSYNRKGLSDEDYLISPEFLSNNPEAIIIKNRLSEVDLLEVEGIERTPLKESDLPMLKSFAKLFVEEYLSYPLAWINEITPPYVVFVKSLEVDNEVVGGVEHGAVIYNISDVYDEEHSRKLIHHELMHWLEHRTKSFEDPAWPGTGYKNEYNFGSTYNYKLHPRAGFVTGYSEVNSAEDKAELYEFLFTDHDKLSEWQKDDVLLEEKLNYLKNFIKHRVDKMDDSYFQSRNN